MVDDKFQKMKGCTASEVIQCTLVCIFLFFKYNDLFFLQNVHCANANLAFVASHPEQFVGFENAKQNNGENIEN